jgi:hypothetical protein
MGRATIVEHLGDALYKVQIHRDSQRVRAIIDKWVAEADSIDAQCAELEAEGSELEAAAAEAKADYEQAQVAYEQAGADKPASESWTEVNKLLGEYLSALAEWEAVANKLFGLQAHARHLRNKASNMEAELAPREDEAWCSTYTTNLAPGTEVATIEVARQGDDYPYHVIAPDGRAPTPDDGQMRSVMSMTPAQTFLNYALWPGAVKWYPRYREGTVIDVDKERQLLKVWLSTPDVPGQQNSFLPEWYEVSLECGFAIRGESVFEVSDSVVVDMGSHTVCGWAKEPKPCRWVVDLSTRTMTGMWDFDPYMTSYTPGWDQGLFDSHDYVRQERYKTQNSNMRGSSEILTGFVWYFDEIDPQGEYSRTRYTSKGGRYGLSVFWRDRVLPPRDWGKILVFTGSCVYVNPSDDGPSYVEPESDSRSEYYLDFNYLFEAINKIFGRDFTEDIPFDSIPAGFGWIDEDYDDDPKWVEMSGENISILKIWFMSDRSPYVWSEGEYPNIESFYLYPQDVVQYLGTVHMRVAVVGHRAAYDFFWGTNESRTIRIKIHLSDEVVDRHKIKL